MADATEKKTPILSRLSPPKGAVRGKKRKGRGPGSKLGTTAGKGSKGQKSRSPGAFSKLTFEGGQTPLARRLPKHGFHNLFSKRIATLNVRDLHRFEAGTVVDVDALKRSGLVKGAFDGIKVLGNGDLDRSLTVRVHAFSAGAKNKIEQAGGKAETLETAKRPSAR